MKKLVALMLCALMVIPTFALAEEEKVLNILSWEGYVDSDTLAAITGSIAEAFYGVPENLKQECRKRLTPDLEEILQACENMLLQR